MKYNFVDANNPKNQTRKSFPCCRHTNSKMNDYDVDDNNNIVQYYAQYILYSIILKSINNIILHSATAA